MHNGQISSFNKLKRTLLSSLDDDLLNFPQGQTDSEWVFALFLSHLDNPERETPFDWKELKSAMEHTIQDLNTWAKQRDVEEPSLMNFCVTDGLSVLCTRYVSSLHDEAASLYFSSGTSFYERSKGMFRMRKEDRRQNIVMVASEPLTFEKADWMEVPTNTMIIITPKMNVLQIPILDEYSPVERPHPAKRVPIADTSRSITPQSGGNHPNKSVNSSTVTAASGRVPLRASGFNIDPATRSRLVPQDDLEAASGTSSPGTATSASAAAVAATAAAAKHRSPDFAIQAGFPPNGHIGNVMGQSVGQTTAQPQDSSA